MDGEEAMLRASDPLPPEHGSSTRGRFQHRGANVWGTGEPQCSVNPAGLKCIWFFKPTLKNHECIAVLNKIKSKQYINFIWLLHAQLSSARLRREEKRRSYAITRPGQTPILFWYRGRGVCNIEYQKVSNTDSWYWLLSKSCTLCLYSFLAALLHLLLLREKFYFLKHGYIPQNKLCKSYEILLWCCIPKVG